MPRLRHDCVISNDVAKGAKIICTFHTSSHAPRLCWAWLFWQWIVMQPLSFHSYTWRDWTRLKRSCYWFVRGSFLLFYRLFTSRSGLTFTVSSSPTQLLWSLSLSCYSLTRKLSAPSELRFANGTTFTTARRRTSPKDKRCSGRRRWPKRW